MYYRTFWVFEYCYLYIFFIINNQHIKKPHSTQNEAFDTFVKVLESFPFNGTTCQKPEANTVYLSRIEEKSI